MGGTVEMTIDATVADGEVAGADLGPLGLEGQQSEGAIRSAVLSLIKSEATPEAARYGVVIYANDFGGISVSVDPEDA